MILSYSNSLLVSIALLILIAPGFSSARRRSHKHGFKATLDQSQSGDHNIHIRLKDFQIVALLGDQSGDYDYHYDEPEITIRPSLISNSSTLSSENVTVSEVPPEAPNAEPASTNNNSPYSFVLPTINKPSEEVPSNSSFEANNTTKPFEGAIIDKLIGNVNESFPGKLARKDDVNKLSQNEQPHITNISILSPAEIPSSPLVNTHSALGEILPRKCVDGYARDRRGRCRKIIRRAPQLPFGLARVASKLVSRLSPKASQKEPFHV